MTIRLISEDERFSTEVEGCTFFYRRLPPDVKEKHTKANTTRGVFDKDAAADDGFEYCVLGWEGVDDVEGNPAPFSIEGLHNLPDPVKLMLVSHIFGTLAGEQVASGNPLAT